MKAQSQMQLQAQAQAKALRTRWDRLAPREKALVGGATLLVAAALLWWVALAPALATLKVADEQHRALDSQVQYMLRLQAQAQAMQGQPRQNTDEAMKALELAIRQHLGTAARYTIAGERVTVSLTGAHSEAVAQFLTQSRVNARALPSELRLARNPVAGWDGTIVVGLPPR
ncbi:type II secretion system protein GspM [Ramlibacter sp.]|uniref:type II secretion system protein GspM n=1 Tax=Ramlibacter sp. TaxID=1917967 RepID=UPI003D10B8B6